MWERKSLPTAIFGASAHPPQAPIWLDPSGCPPGRVSRFRQRNRPATKKLDSTTGDVAAAMPARATVRLDIAYVFHKIYWSCLSDSVRLRPRPYDFPAG